MRKSFEVVAAGWRAYNHAYSLQFARGLQPGDFRAAVCRFETEASMPMNQDKPQPTTPTPNKGSQTQNDPQRASSGQFASTSVRPSPNVTGAPKGKDDAGHRGRPEDMNQKPDSKKADAERRTQPESAKGPAGHTPGNRK